MKNVLITGISGYIGSKVFKALESVSDVEKIVGVDINPPALSSEKLQFFNRDVRRPIVDLLEKYAVDTVVHAAYILPPIHDTALMEDININGTKAVLDGCAKTNVQHLLYTSSATAYGFHADNPIPMSEDQELRGNDNFTYSKNKKEIEALFDRFMSTKHGLKITIFRPCLVIGPGINNPVSSYLLKPVAMLPFPNSQVQFVHEEDLCRAILLSDYLKFAANFRSLPGKGGVSTDALISRGINALRLNLRLKR
jgi:UDP-glucose 4-epimerase